MEPFVCDGDSKAADTAVTGSLSQVLSSTTSGRNSSGFRGCRTGRERWRPSGSRRVERFKFNRSTPASNADPQSLNRKRRTTSDVGNDDGEGLGGGDDHDDDDDDDGVDDDDDDDDDDNDGDIHVDGGIDNDDYDGEDDDDIDEDGEDPRDDEGSGDERVHSQPIIPRPTWVSHTFCRQSSPGRRAGHSLVSHSGFLFVFGGYSDNYIHQNGRESRAGGMHHYMGLLDGDASDGRSGVHGQHWNSVHQFDPETHEWAILCPQTENDGRFPTPRRHASVVVHGDSLFVYGGFDASDSVLSDMWEFKLERRKWLRVLYRGHGRPGSLSNFPNSLGSSDWNLGHSESLIASQGNFHGPGNHVSFAETGQNAIIAAVPGGGPASPGPAGNLGTTLAQYGGAGPVNSVCSTWKPQIPGPRAEHAAVVSSNRMIVFGGYDGKKKLSDTYVFDFATREWLRPVNAELNAPSRRCKHSAVLFRNRLYVLGGFQFNDGSNYAHTDVHCLCLDSFTWSAVLMGLRAPDALQGHRAVVVGESMLVIGGKVRGDPLSDGDTHSSGLNNQVFSYQFDSNRWTVLETSGSQPHPRQLHAAVAVTREHGRSSIFLCGGTDKSKHYNFEDMWELRDLRTKVDSDPSAHCGNCQSTATLVNNPLFSDIRFRVGEELIYAHRCILHTRSKYFRNMFDAGMRECSAEEVPIPDVSHEVMLCVLEHLYTGCVTIKDGRMAVDLLKAADMFGLDRLRSQCVEKVESAVSIENVAFIYEVADLHNASHLKHYCSTFILHNFKEVIHTEAWADLQKRDSGGLGLEILTAFSDSVQFNPSMASKRRRLEH